MAGGKSIHIFIPKYFSSSESSLIGLVTRKLNIATNPSSAQLEFEQYFAKVAPLHTWPFGSP